MMSNLAKGGRDALLRDPGRHVTKLPVSLLSSLFPRVPWPWAGRLLAFNRRTTPDHAGACRCDLLTRLLVLSILVMPLVLGNGCASSSPRLSIPIAGGQSVSLVRQGAGFKPAENDRVVITDAGLQTVNLDGKYYVRWSFSIQPRQAAELSAILIEDVTDPAPLLLVNDVAPQQEGGKWTENAGLMELSSTNGRWLSEPKQTVRVFKFTIKELDGRSYVLYQGVLYSPAAKDAIRAMVGR